MVHARRWLYEHRLLIPHDRRLREMIIAAAIQLERELGNMIQSSVDAEMLARWRTALTGTHRSGLTLQSWLWAAPAKHSVRQIAEVLERIQCLYSLEVHRHLLEVPDTLLRRYARQLASRPPSAGARIKEPMRTVEVACFLRYCLLASTDQLILMVRRRVAELWRQASAAVSERVDWRQRYRELLDELSRLAADEALAESYLRPHLVALVATHAARRPPSRAQATRERLVGDVRAVRSLLTALVRLPWQATGGHPVIDAIEQLRVLYARHARHLPEEVSVPLGSVWRDLIGGADRGRAFRAFEVATLLATRVGHCATARYGSSTALPSAAATRSFSPKSAGAPSEPRHYARLELPHSATAFLHPLLERIRLGVDAVAQAAGDGMLHIDDELHLTALVADEQDPRLAQLRSTLDHSIGEAQLPELILAVDAQVRFSWIMLGREPHSTAPRCRPPRPRA